MEDEYQQFAAALEALMDDPLELIDRFMEISRDQAAQTAQETEEAMDSENFSNWELEARFWQLTATLSDAREKAQTHNDEMEVEESSVYPFSSDASVLQQYKKTHPSTMETFLVNRWLQDNLVASDNEQIEIWGSKWMHTKSDIASKKRLGGGSVGNTSTLVSEMDADAPLRQKKPIAGEDAGYDSKFFRAIFDLVRRRQISEAEELAEKTGNLTLKMAIGGLAAYDDEHADPLDDAKAVGTTRTALWRRMCLSVAASAVSDYEKAVYGFLGGDVSTVLDVSDTWETQLLAYTNNMCSKQFEDALNEAHRVPSKTKTLPLQCSSSVESMEDALELLSESSQVDIRNQAMNPVRKFVGAVINNTVGVIAKSSSEALRVAASTGQPNPVSESALILRVLVHLLLALRTGYGGQEKLNLNHLNIISSYVERLVAEDHYDLVPLYLSFLEPEHVVELYSFYLANISDPDERMRQIQLANQYGVDIKACVKRAVERVFDESMSTYVIPDIRTVHFDSHVSETDVRLYRAVEWFGDVKMWPDTVDASVKLLRRFLLCGKTGAAREAGMRLNVPMLMQQYQADTLGCDANDIEELVALELEQLHGLIVFMDAVHSWQQLISVPKQSRDNAQIVHRVGHIADLAENLIHNWLRDLQQQYMAHPDVTPEDHTHLAQLRQIYVPYIILQLLSVYVQSRHADPSFVVQAVDLSVLVADDEHSIYLDFVDSGRLEEFLSNVFEASALMT